MNTAPPMRGSKSVVVAHAADPGQNDLLKGPLNGRIKKAVLRDWVASGEARTIKISGNSMFPFLRHGDTVTVAPCGRGVRTGDIVVYFMGEVLLIHRVVRVRRTRKGAVLRTKGDFALSFDPAAVKEGDLIGRAVAVRRGKTRIDLNLAPLRACGSVVALLSYSIGLTLGCLRASLQGPH